MHYIKLNYIFIAVSIWAAASPAFAQGAYVTTVTTNASSPVGHQETNRRLVRSSQSSNNQLSTSTDVQGDSNTTTQQSQGTETTKTYNFGSVVTSTVSEKGKSSRTEVFEYSESFDYVDFEFINDVTTGANGDRGPDY